MFENREPLPARQTSRRAYAARRSGSARPAVRTNACSATANLSRDEELYVVQVHGLFTCAACSRPYGAPAQTGSAVGSALPVDGEGETTGGIGPPLDLSRPGTVHTFRVS